MSAPTAVHDPSALEAVLVDVRATLADLLVAANEQHASIVDGDRERLETVTRHQERLSARLAHAEARRMRILGETPLTSAVALLPAEQSDRVANLTRAIGEVALELKERQAHTASLLQQSIDLASQTLQFLQSLVTPAAPAYGSRGLKAGRPSMLVDSRA